MFKRLSGLWGKIHAFTLGTTLALGVVLLGQLGQSCALSGQ